jgi:hypothetical protein
MATTAKVRMATAALVLLAGLFSAAAGEEPVFFRDARLKQRVESTLRIQDPTPTDMLGLTELSGPSHKADLTGLEYATNLQKLSLRMCQISDISLLAGLVNLQELDLSENEISDLSPLAGMTSLRILDMHHNQIRDLSPLSGLTKLQEVVLYNNQISDLSALLGLTNLRYLELRENPLNEQAYCTHLQTLRDNNPQLAVKYSPNRRPPARVTASKGTLPDRVRITWKAVCSGAPDTEPGRCYQVSRTLSADAPPRPIGEWQLSLSFDDLTAEAGTKYFYRVRTATWNQGDEAGDYSEPDMGWVPGPSALTISSGPGGAVVLPGAGQYAPEVGQIMGIRAEPVDANLYFFVGWTGTAVDTGLVADANAASTTINMDNARNTLQANFRSRMDRLYVDDDAPNDPGPGTPMVSDPREDGTPGHPFDMIQEGIDVAREGAIVVARTGTYRECVVFRSRNIKVTSFDPNTPTATEPFPVIDANYIGTAVTFQGGEDANCVLAGFVITRGQSDLVGAVYCGAGSPRVANCLIVGNRAVGSDGCAVSCTGSRAVFANCTIADNLAGAEGTGVYMANSNVTFVNCIISGNAPRDTFAGGRSDGGSKAWMTYSDMLHAPFASDNIEVDPLFARRGRWIDPNDPNAVVAPDILGAVWIGGDYHLKSQAGRWDPAGESWVLDELTSPCIDAGDPNSPVGDEPEPNGGRVNMGAYGGTAEASKSYLIKP